MRLSQHSAYVECFLIAREYSEAAIVTFLFQFGTYLEQRTLKKTRSAIKLLTEMAPATAWRIEGEESEPEKIDADEVEEGDLLLVKAGGKVAVDGIIEFGEGYSNEASINGESVPVALQYQMMLALLLLKPISSYQSLQMKSKI